MSVVVTLRVVFLHTAILVELAMLEHDNEVQESNLCTNLSGHDSIVNNLACDGMPHGDSHPPGMQNMEDGTMSSCSNGMSLGPPKSTRESSDD